MVRASHPVSSSLAKTIRVDKFSILIKALHPVNSSLVKDAGKDASILVRASHPLITRLVKPAFTSVIFRVVSAETLSSPLIDVRFTQLETESVFKLPTQPLPKKNLSLINLLHKVKSIVLILSNPSNVRDSSLSRPVKNFELLNSFASVIVRLVTDDGSIRFIRPFELFRLTVVKDIELIMFVSTFKV